MTALARVLAGILGVAYPVLVYYGLVHWSPRRVAVLVIVAVAVLAILRWRGLDRAHAGAAIGPLLAPIALGVVTAATGDPRALLVAPVLISLALFVTFALSLRPGRMPMVERFARLQEGDRLPARAVPYCRRVTQVWLGFFAVNAVIAGALALFASQAWWALYTGGIAYALIGTIFAIELVVRRIRIRRDAQEAA
ncbi:MAG TPA: hypothetical protein VFG69_00460 [Nannocystaceae bacterium]|nr:hypothetical protein [Nannocystaceae bacterium]